MGGQWRGKKRHGRKRRKGNKRKEGKNKNLI
jgi:hypothetical protein